MMKRLFAMLLAALMLLASAPLAAAEETPRAAHYLEINEQTFPDEAFRMFIRKEYGRCDAEDDWYEPDTVWYMTQEDVLAITELHTNGFLISDFTGLEYFTELKSLSVDSDETEITHFDLSANTKLRQLTLIDFYSDTIDLSPLADLEYLNVQSAWFHSLDL